MAHSDTILDGKPIPSVTQVLGIIRKPFLETWRGKWGNKLCDRKLKASGEIGTAVHDLIENYVHTGIDVVASTRRVRGMAVSVKQWVVENEFQPEMTELKVISKKYRYAGTLDAVGYIKKYPNELVIVDWKSGAGIYPEMALQLAAYAQAYKEMTGIKIRRGIIVQVSKDKPDHKLKTREFKLDKPTLDTFLAALTLWRFVHERSVKRSRSIPEPRIFSNSAQAA